MKIQMICKECGEQARVDFEKSTKNWVVYETKCHKCDGQIIPKVK